MFRAISIFLLCWAASPEGRCAEPCKAYLYFYDKVGRALTGNITHFVNSKSGEAFSVEVIRTMEGISVDGTQMTFRAPHKVIGRQLTVAVLLDDGRAFEARPMIVTCGHRQSFNVGPFDGDESEDMADLSGSLAGCSSFKGWWVRAVRMFGSENTVNQEADVNPKSGQFLMRDFFDGGRHVIIAGKDSEVYSVVAVNVKRGSKNVIAPIDVRKGCGE